MQPRGYLFSYVDIFPPDAIGSDNMAVISHFPSESIRGQLVSGYINFDEFWDIRHVGPNKPPAL